MTTQNSRCYDVKSLLLAATVGPTGVKSDWSIFIGLEPNEPYNCITLYDMPGESPNPKWLVDYPRWQIRVRAVNYNEGFVKAQEARSALLGLFPQDVNGTRYDGIYVVTDVFFLKQDQLKRSIFVSNWRAIVEPQDNDGNRFSL